MKTAEGSVGEMAFYHPSTDPDTPGWRDIRIGWRPNVVGWQPLPAP